MNRNSLLAAALITPVLTAAAGRHRRPFATAMFASHMALLYGMLRPGSQWLGPVVTRFAPGGPEVWLTIDDGPHPGDTDRILDLLEEFGAKATFFVIGRLAAENPGLCRAIAEAGHSIGNHTYTHPSASFWAACGTTLDSEIDRCTLEVAKLPPSSTPPLFRAPAGLKSPLLHPALARRGLQLVGWSARGYDAVEADPGVVANRIERQVTPGSIILLHQGRHIDTEKKGSVATLREVLVRLRSMHLRTVLPGLGSFICKEP